MRSLRHVNIDHLHVGWYQSTYYGSFVSRALLDSQFSYQHAIEESVVLIYGTAAGRANLLARSCAANEGRWERSVASVRLTSAPLPLPLPLSAQLVYLHIDAFCIFPCLYLSVLLFFVVVVC